MPMHLPVKYWQALGLSQAEQLQIVCGAPPHFASGSYAGLTHIMEICDKFDTDHTAPQNEQELLTYCEVLRPALTSLFSMDATHAGTVHKIRQSAQFTNTPATQTTTPSLKTQSWHRQQPGPAAAPACQVHTSSRRSLSATAPV